MRAPRIGIDVQADRAQLAVLKTLLAEVPRGVPRVLSRAINKVGVAARTRIVRRVAQEINVKVGELKKRNILLHKATQKRLAGTVEITGFRIPLLHFAGAQTRRGVGYRIRRGQRRVLAGAFKESGGKPVQMKSGHRGVFIRQLGGAAVKKLRERRLIAQGARLRVRKTATKEEKAAAMGKRSGRVAAFDVLLRKAGAAAIAGRRVPRLPIAELYGPSVPVVFAGVAEFAAGVLDEQLRTQLRGEIDTQVGLALRDHAKKVGVASRG